MAFDWNAYQTAPDINNTTGGPAFTTSQLQTQPSGGGTQYNPYGPGGSNDNITGPPGYYPVGGAPSGGFYGNGTFSPTVQTSVGFDPSMASPSSPTNGGGLHPYDPTQGGVVGPPSMTQGGLGGLGPADPYGMVPQDLEHTQAQARYRESLGLPPTPPPDWQWNAQNPYWGKAQQYSQPSFGGTSGTSGGQDPQAFFNQLFPGDTLTPEMLTQNEAALKAQGITLVRNAAGVPGKIKLPNGQVVDVIQGAGSGLNRKQWLTGDTGSQSGTLGGLGFGSFVSPIGEFTPPTAEDALNSPGLQFALSEANRMGQNSAAAKGTLLNGRFQQALAASNIQNALGGYNDVYNRALQTFGTNFGVQTRNQDAPFSKYLSLAQLGQGAAAAS